MDYPLGREEECESLYESIHRAIDKSQGGIVYVSGMPGSGKTHCCRWALGKVRDEFRAARGAEINCSHLGKPVEIFGAISRALRLKSASLTELRTAIARRFYTICIIDEVDLLINKKQDVLYTLFELPQTCRVFIISISNTYNLPEKAFNHRIRSRVGASRIDFQIYSSEQIARILFSRYKGASEFEASSIDFCSRRVASINGDIRKAIEITESARKKRKKIDIFDIEEVIKKISIPVSNMFIGDLSTYEKIILVLASKRGPSSPSNLYSDMKGHLSLHGHRQISFVQFEFLLDSLCASGILCGKRGRNTIESPFIPEELRNIFRGDRVEHFL